MNSVMTQQSSISNSSKKVIPVRNSKNSNRIITRDKSMNSATISTYSDSLKNQPALSHVDSPHRFIDPSPKLSAQQETKGFISKEVIEKLGTDPHSTSWLLINRNLPDGQKIQDLVSELINIMQGLDGRYIDYDNSSSYFIINNKLNLPDPVANLVYKIAELGYLYRQISKFCSFEKPNLEFGLVRHAFVLAIKSHLDEYTGLMASIDADLSRDLCEKESSYIGLTHLHTATLDYLWKFMYLYNATRVCEGRFGGDLLSVIYKFSVTGNPMLQKVGWSLLYEASKPINRMLAEWLNEGHLTDLNDEFFVFCDDKVKNDRLWYMKYKIRSNMLPSFITLRLAKKILDIGKSINFIKHICQIEYTAKKYTSIIKFSDPQDDDTSDSVTSSLIVIVDTLYDSVCKYVLGLLFEKYQLRLHLDALSRYLLLAQGDFIRHLMELLKPYLSTQADNLRLNNMTSILESAINSTNAQYDSKEVLQRLDCKLAAISKGDLGWDVFTLFYHTRGPLQVVVDSRSMEKYLKIFHFLWFIKRTVYLMDELSKDEIVCHREYKVIKEGRDLFYHLSICKHEMFHFINQLEYFITFEVLECSRANLHVELESAKGLDDVIVAHDMFLNNVLSLCFLSEQSELIMPKLHDAFKKVIHFESHFRSIISLFSSEKQRRASDAINRKDDFNKTILFWKEKINHLCEIFRKLMIEFMQALMDSSNSQHYYLAFRLDFNEFYLKHLSSDHRNKLRRRSLAGLSLRIS